MVHSLFWLSSIVVWATLIAIIIKAFSSFKKTKLSPWLLLACVAGLYGPIELLQRAGDDSKHSLFYAFPHHSVWKGSDQAVMSKYLRNIQKKGEAKTKHPLGTHIFMYPISFLDTERRARAKANEMNKKFSFLALLFIIPATLALFLLIVFNCIREFSGKELSTRQLQKALGITLGLLVIFFCVYIWGGDAYTSSRKVHLGLRRNLGIVFGPEAISTLFCMYLGFWFSIKNASRWDYLLFGLCSGSSLIFSERNIVFVFPAIALLIFNFWKSKGWLLLLHSALGFAVGFSLNSILLWITRGSALMENRTRYWEVKRERYQEYVANRYDFHPDDLSQIGWVSYRYIKTNFWDTLTLFYPNILCAVVLAVGATMLWKKTASMRNLNALRNPAIQQMLFLSSACIASYVMILSYIRIGAVFRYGHLFPFTWTAAIAVVSCTFFLLHSEEEKGIS